MRWKDRFKGFAEEAVAEHGGRSQAVFAGLVTAIAGILLFIFGLDAFLQEANSGIGVGRWIYLAGALVGVVATTSQTLMISEITKDTASSEAE